MSERQSVASGGSYAWSATGLDRAVSFLTPLGSAAPPSPAAIPWFPLVGVAIGVAIGAVWYWSTRAFGPLVGAVLAVVTDLVLTGMLHMDGLADSADGLLCHVDAGAPFYGGPMGPRDPVARAANAARRLEIMADPAVGAYGTIAVAAVSLCRVAALATIGTNLAGSVILAGGLWCASRALMAVGLVTLPYARVEGGLASGFRVPSAGSPRASGTGRSRAGVRNGWHLGWALFCLAAAGALLGYWQVRNGVAAFGAGTLAGVGVLAMGRKRLGGFTGDLLGASGVILETVGLLAAAAHWSAL